VGARFHPAVIEAATKAKVKQLAVFHHDPQHSDKYLDDLWVSTALGVWLILTPWTFSGLGKALPSRSSIVSRKYHK